MLHENSTLVASHGYYHSPTHGSCFQSDTWAFDVASRKWEKWRFPGAPVPPERFEHSAALDEGGEFMYLFGGTDGGTRHNGGSTFLFGPSAEFNDLWRLKLKHPRRWEDLSGTGGRPSPRCEQGMVWACGRLWVYGGLQGDTSGTADGLVALGDLWSWTPADGRWRESDLSGSCLVLPRYGHSCTPAKLRGGDGFFVCGGRRRNDGSRDILNELWFCDVSNGSVAAWELLAMPTVPAWQPRFHHAACPFGPNGVMIVGGNVSTGLLRLPVDAWLYQMNGDSVEHWTALSIAGDVDPEGNTHPFGRVHATVAVVAPEGGGSSRLLLFGGESTRPYMYHSSVYEALLELPQSPN